MGWAIGYDNRWKRDIGYGVPTICDHPKCNEEIDRGLGYVCGEDVYGGEKGCGLFFCGKHQIGKHQRCPQCTYRSLRTYKPKPDMVEWEYYKLKAESWNKWRDNHPDEVERITKRCSTLMYVLEELQEITSVEIVER
jgi:hypothetical protein